MNNLKASKEKKETLELKVKNLRQTGFSSQSHETVPKISVLDKEILKLTEETTKLKLKLARMVKNLIHQNTKNQKETNKRILEIDAEISKLTENQIKTTKETKSVVGTPLPLPEDSHPLGAAAIVGIVSGALGAFVMIVLITIFFKNKFKEQKLRKTKGDKQKWT